MCNLQSNLKLNERKRGNSSDCGRGRGKISQRVEDTAGGVGREIVKDKAGDRAITTKKEMHRQRECLVESPWHLYSLHSGIPSGSLQDLFSRCLQKCVDRERGTRVAAGVRRANQGRGGGVQKVGNTGRGDSTMRARLARHCHPLLASLLCPTSPTHPPPSHCTLPIRSHRNPGDSSLFLASRACENSGTQAAFGPRRIVEDVQETSYRANYPRLTTLPAGLTAPSTRIHVNLLGLVVEIRRRY